MPTASVPRSAQALIGTERPTLAQVRQLRRIATQDTEERGRLLALHQDGLPGVKDKTRQAILALALGRFADAEELIDPKDAYGQALLGLVYAELGEYADAKSAFQAAAKSVPEAKAEMVRAMIAAGSLDEAEKAFSSIVDPAERDFQQGCILEARNNVEGAIKALEGALEAAPSTSKPPLRSVSCSTVLAMTTSPPNTTWCAPTCGPPTSPA